MSRDLSRVTPPSHPTLGPEAPVIMPPLPNEQGAHGRAPYDSFLCHSPPANTWIAVETSHSEYSLLVRLPGFRRDGMLVYFLSISNLFNSYTPSEPLLQEGVAYYMSSQIRGSLKAVCPTIPNNVVMYSVYTLGHFERRVSFGYDAELAQVRAEFDGEMLRIVVPRRLSAISS